MGDNYPTTLIPHKLICDLFTRWRTDEGASLFIGGRNPVTVSVQYHCDWVEARNHAGQYNHVKRPALRYQFEVNLADPEALVKVEQRFIWLQGFAAGLVAAGLVDVEMVGPKIWA